MTDDCSIVASARTPVALPGAAARRRRRRRPGRPAGAGRGRQREAVTATRSRRRWTGSAGAPSGSTWSTSTPRSAAAHNRDAARRDRRRAGRRRWSCPAASATTRSLEAALATGCRRVNIGTAALEDPEWCAARSRRYGDRIAVGLDVRGTTLAARGWTAEGGELYEVLARLDAEGCARYVVTDVNKDGTLQGPNLDLLRAVCAATDQPVVASGGVTSWPTCAALAAWSPSASRARSSARRSTRARSPSRTALALTRPERRMTLAVRVIPCLDVDAGRVVKGVNFQDLRDAGDPVELARSTTPRAPTS